LIFDEISHYPKLKYWKKMGNFDLCQFFHFSTDIYFIPGSIHDLPGSIHNPPGGRNFGWKLKSFENFVPTTHHLHPPTVTSESIVYEKVFSMMRLDYYYYQRF
jgi:hypothetical protein